MHDVYRHRENRFRNKPFFKVDRVHESFINEFGKRRNFEQDRKQNIINNRFPSLAEARDQYLKQTFQAPQKINDETTNAQSASYDDVADPSGS